MIGFGGCEKGLFLYEVWFRLLKSARSVPRRIWEPFDLGATFYTGKRFVAEWARNLLL